VAGSGVQDICPMKPRFRKTNLLITHVLDQCVKLLAVLHIKRSGSVCGVRNGQDDRYDVSSGSSAIWRIISYYLHCSACRSLLLHNSPSGVSHTTRWTRRRQIVRCYVCAVLVPCMHHDGSFCRGSSLRQPAPRSEPLPIMF